MHGIDLDSWYRIGTAEWHTYKRAECYPFAGFLNIMIKLHKVHMEKKLQDFETIEYSSTSDEESEEEEITRFQADSELQESTNQPNNRSPPDHEIPSAAPRLAQWEYLHLLYLMEWWMETLIVFNIINILQILLVNTYGKEMTLKGTWKVFYECSKRIEMHWRNLNKQTKSNPALLDKTNKQTDIICYVYHRAFPLFGLVSPSFGQGSPVVTQRQMIKIVGLSWR